MATNVGNIQLLATIDTSRYKQGAQEIESTNDRLEGSAAKTSKRSNALFTGIAKVGLAAVAAAAVAVGVAITKNIGNAVNRIDTLVAFPKMLKALGSSSDEAQEATDKLKESLQGLPTPLQDGAKGVQALVATGLSAKDATDSFLAFNNAMLAASVDSAAAEATFTQLTQAISRGKIEGQEWNSITANMPTALKALQEQSGKTKGELQEFYRTDPDQLLKDLVKLNEEGGGGLASLEEQARTATGGIGTAFDNMNNAITRGLESIVRTLGDGDLEAGQLRISNAVNKVGAAFEKTLNVIGQFLEFLIRNSAVFGPIIAAMGTIIGLLTAWFVATKILAAGQAVLNAVLAANPIGLVVIAILGLIAAIVYLWNNVAGFRNFFIKAWDMIKNAVTSVWNWVKKNWPMIVGFLTGPIGSAVSSIIRHFNRIRSIAGSVWSWIKGTFSRIGDVASGVFRGAVNAVIGGAQRIINGFINSVNGIINTINKIPGVNLGTIGNFNLPKLASGGIVTSPTMAMVGEGGEPEAVIPLSKLDKMLSGETNNNSNITINLSGVMARSRSDLREIGKDIIKAIDEERTAKGLNPINGVTA